MTAPEVVPCGRCGRPLSDPESRARGYGRVCADIVLGIDTHRTPVSAGPRRKNTDQIPLPLEKPVDAETRKAAIDTVARHALARCIEQTADNGTGRIDWGDYPELAHRAWNDVVDRIDAIAASIRPTAESYKAAYEHLTPGP